MISETIFPVKFLHGINAFLLLSKNQDYYKN